MKGIQNACIEKMVRILTLFAMLLITGSGVAGVHGGSLPETDGLQQAKVRITGAVVDQMGDPVVGASIVEKDVLTNGTTTDADGNFILSVSTRATLIVSYIGYTKQEVAVGNRSRVDIILQEDLQALEEVTVVAFAKQKKESVIGAIATINASELKVPSSNLTTAFAGKVAGVISYQTSGEPGQDNAQFFIRGITSFGAAAKKDPLILIDGVELTTDDLARLNTDDIASFSIMKDATSTALYGARGANGVILVTTKEGSLGGKVKVNARVENSFSSPTRMIRVADPITYMRMHNEAIITRDPNGIPEYSAEKIEMTARGTHPDIYPATDWYGTMFNQVISNQRANLSLSGGGSVARYYVAVNIAQDNGNIKVDKRNDFNNNINLTKYAIRTNVNVNLTKTTELVFKLSSTFDEYVGPLDGGSAMYKKVIQANPVLFKPYYEPDEEYAYADYILFGNYNQANYINPYAESLKGYRDYSTNTTSTQFGINQKLDMITKGLNFRAMINMNRYSYFSVTRSYRPYYFNIGTYSLLDNTYTLRPLNNGDDKLGYSPGDRTINTSIYMEATTEYNRQFADKHTVGALLVYIMRQEKQGVADNLFLSLPHRNLGLSGRATYNYDSRYFFEFNFGYNGSERFSDKHRWGFFPSAGLAWMLSNEAFFEPLKDIFTNVKLKGTYGLVGNDQIGSSSDRFYYLSRVDKVSNKNPGWGLYLSNNPGSFNVAQYANNNIGWETAYKTNLGLEIALKNGLSLIADVFRERRENILIDRIIPGTMGIIPSVKANLGIGSGQGFEIEANYEKSFNKDFFLTGRGTFTYATNEVVEWEEPDYSETPCRSRVGMNIYHRQGYIAERLFVDEHEVLNSPGQFGTVMAGDIKYRDINDDGRISALDQVPIGYPTEPEITYGFGLTAGYKHFDASFFFQGSARRSFWLTLNGNGRIQPFLDGTENDNLIGQNAIIMPIVDSYWSESNRDPYAFWPRLSNYSIENNRQTSTWFMYDASFLRLKSAEIGYTLPEKLAGKVLLSHLRIYVNGTNLLRWSPFTFWDPEMGGNGLGYPLQRVFNVGMNIGF
jgi:TonB-linked SusC/RagA family outer membrane protein